MKRRDFNKNLAVLATSAPLALAAFDKNAPAGKYQVTIGDSSEVYPAIGSSRVNVKTNPVFVITHEGKTEVLVFNSKLEYITAAPKKNAQGFRIADVKLQNWKGTTYSKLLGKDLSFVVTNVHKSQLKSNNMNQDFPSSLLLNVEFDLIADGEILHKGISAKVNTTMNGFAPDVRNLLAVESKSKNIGKSQAMEVVFLCA